MTNSKRVVVLIMLVVVLLLLTAIVFVGVRVFYLSTESQKNSKPVETPEIVKEIPRNSVPYSDAVVETFDESVSLRLNNLDNDGALALLKAKYAEAKTEDDAAWYYLGMASLIVAKDPQLGLQMFAELFNNTDLAREVRGEALFSGMLYASKIQKPEFTVEEAKEWIFSDERFGPKVGINASNYDNIKTDEDVMRLAITGLTASTGYTSSPVKQIRAVTETAVLKMELEIKTLYDKAMAVSPNGDTVALMQNELKNSPQLQFVFNQTLKDLRNAQTLILEKSPETEASPEHVSDYLYGFGFIQRAYTEMLYMGLDVSADIANVRTQLKEYGDSYKDDNLYAQARTHLVQSTSDMRFACSQVIEADFDITKIDAVEIKKLLAGMYSLSDEEIAAHGSLLKAIAERPYIACYEPFVFIGNEIDPAFKEFLIKRVGGWTEMNFTKE